MVEKIKSIQPKTGKNHRCFGSRYLRMHNFRDSRWTVADKVTQYQGLAMMHDKDQRLGALARTAETKKRLRQIVRLRQDVKDDREMLKVAVFGDTLRTQNLLQNHKNLQRLYQSMPSHLVVENMDQRTFVKRKELDRLLDRKNKLRAKYETKLLELSKIQDRMKYNDVIPFGDDEISKKLRLDLRNTETRTKVIKAINKAYRQIITVMMKDSLYFEPVLDALEEDIEEQQSFIDTCIRLGRPALANVDKLSKDYEELQKQTQNEIKPRLETLKEYRSKIEKNNETIKELVRRDSDFQIFPKRYQRITDSIQELKTNMEEVEKVMKHVQGVTSCDQASQVFRRVRNQAKLNIQMEGNIIPKEHARNAANERDVHATVQSEALNHNLTPAEIDRVNEIQSLRERINNEDNQQLEMNQEITKRNEMLTKLKLSFQHINDVLRHVGEKHTAVRQYDNNDLKLPLLKLGSFAPRNLPPTPVEENVDVIRKLIKDRVTMLMKVYDNKQYDSQQDACNAAFHDAVLKDMRSEEVKALEAAIDPNEVNRMPDEDASVLSRLRLKAISGRIVEQNTKKDDFGKKK